MKLLFGEHEITLDEKNRLLIPSDIRRAFEPEKQDSEAFFLVVGINKVLWLWPERKYEEMASQQDSELMPEDERLSSDQLNFGPVARLEWDKQGRTVLPEKFVRRGRLSKELTLVGVRDHIELWNRAEWEQRQQELDDRRPEIALRNRQLERAERQQDVAPAGR